MAQFPAFAQAISASADQATGESSIISEHEALRGPHLERAMSHRGRIEARGPHAKEHSPFRKSLKSGRIGAQKGSTMGSTKEKQREGSRHEGEKLTKLELSIPKRSLAALDELCRLHRISRDEALQAALNDYLREHARSIRRSAFGLWKNQERQGTDLQSALRGKW
jgi:hypothetical protein